MIGFLIVAAITVFGGLGVVLAKQPVHSALFLIANIIALAVFYILLSATFLAAAQVIVYAGAIMVLFLFVVTLLTAGKDDREPKESLGGQRVVAIVTSLVAGMGITWAAISNPGPRIALGAPKNFGNLTTIGKLLWGPDFIFLFSIGLMLLTASLGVLVLNRPKILAVAKRTPNEASVKPPERRTM